MPEGPEIKLAADKIAKAIEGSEVVSIFFAFDHLKHFESLLQGEKIESVKPRGKALLIRFSNELTIYSHNQLYGKWYTRLKRSGAPKTSRQLRLAIHNEKRSAYLYSASDIEVLRPAEVESHSFLSKLGPDILDEHTTVETIQNVIIAKRFQNRQLGHLLLDQGWLSGIGNYLRSEILFLSKLPPSRRPRELSDEQITNLAEIIRAICRQSYETKGITNDLERVALLREEGMRRSALRHHVFARAGQHCYACSDTVQKLEWSGRRIYVCPTCQHM